MSEIAARPAWGEGVSISPPILHSLRFEWKGGTEADVRNARTEYSLGLYRFGRLRLGIQFGAAISGVPRLEARAVFRMIVTFAPDSSEAADPESAFKPFAARVGPLTMYPFVREAITSAAMKAQLTALALPVADVGALFTEDEIQIPPVDPSGDEDPGDDLFQGE